MRDEGYRRTVRWLMRAQELERRIALRVEEAERLRLRIMPGASVAGGGAKSRGSGDWTDRLAAAMEIEDDIRREIRSLRRTRQEIVRTIGQVRNGEQRQVLEQRYLGGKKFDEIARALHYERTWVWRTHAQGVAAVKRQREGKKQQHKTTSECDII